MTVARNEAPMNVFAIKDLVLKLVTDYDLSDADACHLASTCHQLKKALQDHLTNIANFNRLQHIASGLQARTKKAEQQLAVNPTLFSSEQIRPVVLRRLRLSSINEVEKVLATPLSDKQAELLAYENQDVIKNVSHLCRMLQMMPAKARYQYAIVNAHHVKNAFQFSQVVAKLTPEEKAQYVNIMPDKIKIKYLK